MKNAEEKLKGIYKRQNEHIAEHYDRVNAILPKGYKERIRATGQTLNAFITQAVKAELERLEGQSPQPAPLPQASAVPDPEPQQAPQEIEPALVELQAELQNRRAEREQIKTREGTTATDPQPLSVREVAEHTRQTAKEEAEKRAKAAQPTAQELAVAELLKRRS